MGAGLTLGLQPPDETWCSCKRDGALNGATCLLPPSSHAQWLNSCFSDSLLLLLLLLPSSSGPWEFNLAPGEPAVPLLQLLFFFLSRARIRNFTIYPRISRARCRAVSSILFILAAAVVDPGTLVEGGLVSNGSHFPAGHTCSPAQTGGALTRGEEDPI